MTPKNSKIRFILFVLLTICSYAQEEPFMDYVLRWDGQSSVLRVELTYSAHQKDSTVFIFGDPNWGGQADIFKVIRNITSSEPEVVRVDEVNRQISVYHNGANKHTISYEIDGSLPPDLPTRASQTELFRPVISEGVLTLVNKQFALTVTDKSNPRVSFRWHSYPKNFSYFNSIDPSQKSPSEKLSVYYEDLSNAVCFVMGNNISVMEYSVLGVPYFSVTTKEDRYGNDLQGSLIPFFKSYFPSIHRFWNDTDFPFYFLSVTALQNNQTEIGAGGFGINNGFIMKLGRKFGT
ncbi:hypothetical protein [Flavobacterium beibuense]|uniref:Uncharacterized protein n=1 Tax=Flavobacterium beibuense TaxID=657326 RepID=A0A444WAC5_9FLAO|nr:hypothetical protein [Flavobacterium beibuense]RYJ42830.1 hypothetical protein NU09_1929 [Flavobacterium beibuense]